MRNRSRTFRMLRDERGVALPLALLGLISVSLLVTTALVTSSTEVAISNAHQDATRGLYLAEGGLQAYLAGSGSGMMADTGVTFGYQPSSGTTEETVQMTVLPLGEQLMSDQSILRTFSVTAVHPGSGGRGVSTLVRQVIPPPVPLNTNIKSAITLGGDLDVNGNAFTVTGRSTACGASGVQAVRHASTSTIAVNNKSHWDNFVGVDSLGNQTQGKAAVQNSSLSKQALVAEALGLGDGQDIYDLIDRVPASKKWGPRYTPQGQPTRVFDGRVDPGELVAVVDGNGVTVDLLGGSGLFIVVNGDVRMTGTASFKGIIIVEGNFTLKGTPTVTGALISMDDDERNQIELDASAIANGHITVEYNKCEIDKAEDGFGQATQYSQTPTIAGTSGWIEVSR